MAHVLIFGQTLSGKTTLAKTVLVPAYKRDGVGVIVLDPLNDPEWHADYQTSDPDMFLDVVWKSRKCAIFIDEAGENVDRWNKPMIETATRGRHWGHRCHYISQRGAQLSTTVRDQCSTLFLFTTSVQDCKIHANEWNKEGLRAGNTLEQGEYFHATRFGKLTRHTLF